MGEAETKGETKVNIFRAWRKNEFRRDDPYYVLVGSWMSGK